MNDNQLDSYKKKRDFRKTNEPHGSQKSGQKAPIFVIQKHDASQLHYDFRLQCENVLVSWAVPKGLSTAANNKRLAIRTEDHPLSYAEFEGIIPKPQRYGLKNIFRRLAQITDPWQHFFFPRD